MVLSINYYLGGQMEEELKEKYMQFQVLQQHIEQISEHLQMFNQQIQEIEISTDSLKEVAETSENTEMLCPLANGIFLKTKLNDNKSIIVNVGADTTVEKNIPQVIEMLENQKHKVLKKIVEAESMLQEMHTQAMKIYKEVEGA